MISYMCIIYKPNPKLKPNPELKPKPKAICAAKSGHMAHAYIDNTTTEEHQ